MVARFLAFVVLITVSGCASAMEHDRMYPLQVPIVDSRALHPVTGKPINCELRAPFESRFNQVYEPLADIRYSWYYPTVGEIGGGRVYVFGINTEPRSQGVAMSRACREATTKWNNVTIGMPKDQVRGDWGHPTTITDAGQSEQWWYISGQQLHFENGRLRTIQGTKQP